MVLPIYPGNFSHDRNSLRSQLALTTAFGVRTIRIHRDQAIPNQHRPLVVALAAGSAGALGQSAAILRHAPSQINFFLDMSQLQEQFL